MNSIDDEETVLGVAIVTDNRVASRIFGVSLMLLESDEQQLFADQPGYTALAEAWDALRLADDLILPNKWTRDTLLRLVPNPPIDKLNAAIDLQVLARTLEPHHHSFTLASSAERLGYQRIGYKGSHVWTPQAMAAVRVDGLICNLLYQHLGAISAERDR